MDHAFLNSIFEDLNADYCASEAHGAATGVLCADPQADIQKWLGYLRLDPDTLEEKDCETIQSMFEETRSSLTDQDFELGFDLLLPDEDEPLFEQTEALRVWCQGFLFGIGFSQSARKWPGELGEVISDVIEFTKIDIESETEDEANALMEIHEYLRVAVLTVRDFFAEAASAPKH